VATWGHSRGQFSSGPGPTVEVEHEDGRRQVNGAHRGRLQRRGDGGGAHLGVVA
jgi:hypothetical protein